MVNTVFACTCDPLGPLKVTLPPLTTPDPPVMVPYEEATVTELDEEPELDVCEHVNFPLCVLVVAAQAPPLQLNVIQVGRHWQLPEVMGLPVLVFSINARAAESAVQALYCELHLLLPLLAGVPCLVFIVGSMAGALIALVAMAVAIGAVTMVAMPGPMPGGAGAAVAIPIVFIPMSAGPGRASALASASATNSFTEDVLIWVDWVCL